MGNYKMKLIKLIFAAATCLSVSLASNVNEIEQNYITELEEGPKAKKVLKVLKKGIKKIAKKEEEDEDEDEESKPAQTIKESS